MPASVHGNDRIRPCGHGTLPWASLATVIAAGPISDPGSGTMSESRQTAAVKLEIDDKGATEHLPTGCPALAAIGIGRRDPKTDAWLIREVNMAVHYGDRLGIVGSSGAGKTVLLRALAMLDPISAGEILWNGQSVRRDSVPAFRKQVIYLHQRPALYEGNVEDNLRYPFTLKGHRSNAFDRSRVLDLLAALGRDAGFLAKSSRDLSGGEAQIVALIRAIQLEPSVLLLDEPTASLDPGTAQALEDVIDRWLSAKTGERALVWVSHDREQTLRMTAQTITLHSGRVIVEQ
jgi:putative ABC transport system ATP-binding protein